ncbi:MAG: nodulation protein NfeD [Cytophagales bacterium]|nr:nodulation protein NfeD [Cytophagales bacterium]
MFRTIILFTILLFSSFSAIDSRVKVLVIEIKAQIDPRMSRYIKLAFEEAKSIDADYIVIDMNTYGGIVVDADTIRTRILNSAIPVYVFINNNAASAGALISIACDSIYMVSGANIGAATVVTEDGKAAPDKYQSYMRSMMRSTAEAKGRDPKIAEAMVEEKLGVDSVSQVGQVVTFTTSEAIKNGFCEGEVNSIEDILAKCKIENYELIHFKLGSAEKVIAFFLNPVVSGILMMVIIMGIYFELQTPGVGFPLIASIIAATLYFSPYYLNGLAAHWEIAMFFAGLVLIGLEVLVIPGFGIAGISGIILTFFSLILVMISNDLFDFSYVNTDEIYNAALTLFIGLTGGILVITVGGVKFFNSKMFQKIALLKKLESKKGFTSKFTTQPMTGSKGTTYTVLRPSGKVMIEGSLFDANSRGEFIDKNTEVVVIGESGTSLTVKAHGA